MHYSGAVYRPPSEARSLIVQCTLGCSHNKCAFCTMYKDKKFSINPIEQVLSDLDEARAYGRYIEKIFLADGDALILPMDYLLTVLDYICDHFPTCKRVAAYATTKAIMRKTDDELRTLREHGLGIVYIGLESGNEELLKKFCKGVTAEEIVLNAIRCKQAGIATSVTAINGMAGANGDWQDPPRLHGEGRFPHEARLYRVFDASRLLGHAAARLDRERRVQDDGAARADA